MRVHIPPLIYSAKAGYLLEKELRALDGVRKISIKKELGKMSVHYDSVMASERHLFLAIDRVATPLIREDQQASYEKTLAEVESAQLKRLARKATVTVILAYLVNIHWRLISRKWMRDPITHWPKLASIGVLIYIHRKHIKGGVGLE